MLTIAFIGNMESGKSVISGWGRDYRTKSNPSSVTYRLSIETGKDIKVIDQNVDPFLHWNGRNLDMI